MLHRCCCSRAGAWWGWGCCCRCRRGRHSRCCCFLVISLAGNTPPKNSRPTVELIPLTRDAWRRRPLVTTAMDGMSDVATCPTCLKVFNKKSNLTRHQKHTLSCSGPRKQLERPQRSPCGGGLGETAVSAAATTTRPGQLQNVLDSGGRGAACACLLHQVFAQRSAARIAVLRWAAVP